MNRPPLPLYTDETAAQKAQMAEDAWNSRGQVSPDRRVAVAPCGFSEGAIGAVE